MIISLPKFAILLLLILATTLPPVEEPPVEEPKSIRNVWVTSDIGQGDPDDIQSMIHLLQFSDQLKIRGITVGYPRGDVSVLERVLEAYGEDYRNNRGFDNHIKPWRIDYFQGQQREADWSSNRAVRALVRESHKDRYSWREPLIILSWGACTDVVAAIENGLNRRNVFIYAVSGFTSLDWNATQDPRSFERLVDAVRYRRILAGSTIRGIYFGWNLRRNRAFVRRNVTPFGALGREFMRASRGINTGSDSIKMGDTPSVLWALSSERLRPVQESVGGSFEKYDTRLWGVRSDMSIGIFPGAATIQRVRFTRSWERQIKQIYGAD